MIAYFKNHSSAIVYSPKTTYSLPKTEAKALNKLGLFRFFCLFQADSNLSPKSLDESSSMTL